jgi:hypothetical protein
MSTGNDAGNSIDLSSNNMLWPFRPIKIKVFLIILKYSLNAQNQ